MVHRFGMQPAHACSPLLLVLAVASARRVLLLRDMCALLRLLLAQLLLHSGTIGAKVAIIGGGIGGASSAYFLRKLTPPGTELVLHLFNHGPVGGRVATVQMQHDGKDRMFEAGGSVIHQANAYIKRWMKEFGRVATVQMQHDGKDRMFEAGGSVIHQANAYIKRWMKEFGKYFDLHEKDTPDDYGTSGIWDGSRFVFMKSSWYIMTVLRALQHYGLSTLKNRLETAAFLADFRNIYKLLDTIQ
ncbi:unnamed protein product [Gongylonema pulchrum]|uniref:Prenylcys_lyase domain-containing protein n=1 Tax=Gongylonema pulchrum TaxID=637853 RepID=A0A183EEN6_9BILA|nr:unnamed protein product [Gongylonema pulchrum]